MEESPMKSEKKPAPYKVILTGHQAVGKSSLLHRITEANFIEEYHTTIGVDFKTIEVQLVDRSVDIQIWDTAGQEKFRGLTNSYFRNSHGCICVYDVKQPHTLEYAKGYIETALEFGISKQCIVLVANKSDQLEKSEQVYQQHGQEEADRLNIYWELVSAKSGHNVDKFSKNLATRLYSTFGKIKTIEKPMLKIEDGKEKKNCAAC